MPKQSGSIFWNVRKYEIFNIGYYAITFPGVGGINSSSTPVSAFATDGVNSLSYTALVPRDIIALGTANTFFDYLIPRELSHVVVFCGYV